MYQKHLKNNPIHASVPNSDKPLKTKNVSEADKAEIEICLNCEKTDCKYGNCKKVKKI